MRNIKLTLEYDGTDFHGWQFQPDLRTVQGVMEEALGKLLEEPIQVVGAGRTDRGVHATGQVANFKTEKEIPLSGILDGGNSLLPEDLTIKRVEEVPLDFNARFDSKGKIYRYRITRERSSIHRRYTWKVDRKLDLDRMQEGAKVFIGNHDFTSFSKNGDSGDQENPESSVTSISRCGWHKNGDSVVFEIEGIRFLRYMVRIVVGTLVDVGRGRFSPEEIRGMLSPDAYTHPVDDVELRQTHISYLLFAGDFVYKVKKPLDLSFLNFSTLEKRRHFCEEEVRLNRRLCDRTYVGVVPIATVGGEMKVDGEGEAIEYAVKMRRLPDEGMMPALLERNEVTRSMVAGLARGIADFHGSSERSEEIERHGGLETVALNWRENFEQTEPFIGRTISRQQFDEIQRFVNGVAEEDADLFDQRVRERRVRDCHGDLRADAVCFEGDGVCIFDCIEFNERFRFCDVASDIAFLAMDLEFRGRQDLSDELLSHYLGATLDSTLPILLPFYKCYRAYVRGKVDGFQLDQPEIGEVQKTQVAAGARRSFELAHQYATRPAPRGLIITVGLTGSGKSYLANALAARVGALVLSADVVRKRLAGIEPTVRRTEPVDQGMYSPEATDRTYAALLDVARPWLERGKPVILDASYLRRGHRRAAVRLAQETNVRFLALECEADESLVRERLSARRDEERVVSDGRWEIYQAQQERREPLDELPGESRLAVETARPLQEQIDGVLARLGQPEQ